MVDCAIPNCFTSRNEKSKGMSLFKIPGGKDEYSMKWSKELLNIITKYRIIDTKLRKLIESKCLIFVKDIICQIRSYIVSIYTIIIIYLPRINYQ